MLSLYSAVMPILQPSVSTRYTIHLITSPRALRSLLAASGTSRLNVYVLDVRARNFRRPANVIYSLHDVVSAGVCVGCVFGNCIWALSGMMIGFFVGMPCRYRGSSRPACIQLPIRKTFQCHYLIFSSCRTDSSPRIHPDLSQHARSSHVKYQ